MHLLYVGLIFWRRRELVSTILKGFLHHFNEDIVQIPQVKQKIPRTSPVQNYVVIPYPQYMVVCHCMSVREDYSKKHGISKKFTGNRGVEGIGLPTKG